MMRFVVKLWRSGNGDTDSPRMYYAWNGSTELGKYLLKTGNVSTAAHLGSGPLSNAELIAKPDSAYCASVDEVEALVKRFHYELYPFATKFGPTFRSECPKCGNSSQNESVWKSILTCCASCKTLFVSHESRQSLIT